MHQFNPVLLATADKISAWIETAKSQLVNPEDKRLIESGSAEGRRRYFEILYGQSFLAMNSSFHASLRDYCTRIRERNLGFHEAAAVASFLGIVLSEVAEMNAVGFIDGDLAALAGDTAIEKFLRRFD